jgi:hypothetical protein
MGKVTPNAKDLKPDGWVVEVERMFRLDERPPKEAAVLFRWVARHEFWSSNVRCGAKFRKQYDRLLLEKRNEENPIQVRHRERDDNRERVVVPVPKGLVVPQGLTIRAALEAEQERAEAISDPEEKRAALALVKQMRFEYGQALMTIAERGQVPEEE